MTEVFINQFSAFLPNEPVLNDEMEQVLGYINGKPSRARSIVLKKNGIKARYYAIDKNSGELTHNNAQLTAQAVKSLEYTGNIEFLACGTSSPDQIIPSHGVMVHGALGIPPCEVVATSGVCTSGISALKYAFFSVLTGNTRNAVVTGSELVSSCLLAKNFQVESESKISQLEQRPEIAFDKEFLRWMLSDGAGAALLQNQPNTHGLSLKIEWIEQVSYANTAEVCMYSGGEKHQNGSFKGWREFPSSMDIVNKSLFAVQQDVKLLDKTIGPLMEKGFAMAVDKHRLVPEEINYLLPHLSSKYFFSKLEAGLEKVNFPVPQQNWFSNLTSKGNIGSASMFVMLEELFNGEKLQKGEKIMCFIPESGRFSIAVMLLSVV